jgi:hypothetical protein
MLEAKNWTTFLQKFDGHNIEVACQFALKFKKNKVKIGGMEFDINEDVISEAIGLPNIGEKYFKIKHFQEKSWVPFVMRSRVSSISWKNGTQRSWLVHPWDELVYIIQNFVTCETRYSIIYLYHIKLLQHLRGDCMINLPHFLLKSLIKMSKKAQKQVEDVEKGIYHCGIIKIILTHELMKKGMTWQQFLIEKGFQSNVVQENEAVTKISDDDKNDVINPKTTCQKPSLGRRTLQAAQADSSGGQ